MMPTHRLCRPSALVLLCVAFGFAKNARAASVEDASKAELKSATESFQIGVAALDAERFQEALDSFQRSYAIVASPNSRMMVGRCLVKLGRLTEAYRELSHTISEVNESVQAQKKYKKTLETAQKELDEIKPRLSFVRLRPPARVTLLGKEIDSSTWADSLPVMPGTVALELVFPDGRKVLKQLTLKPGESTEFVADAPATQQTAPTRPNLTTEAPKADRTDALERKTVGYVAGAVGVIGVGVFVGVGLVGAASYGDSHADCTALGCPSAAVDNEGKESLLRGIGYTGLGVGVLGLGAATWLLLSGGDSAQTTALGIAPGKIQLEHRF